MLELTNLIGGRRRGAAGSIPVVDPARGDPIALCPDSSARDIDDAVRAAAGAFAAWAGAPAAHRAALMNRLADLIDRDAERLAHLESLNTGKPIALARAVDIPRSSDNLRFFAGAILHDHTEAFETTGAVRAGLQSAAAINTVLRRPRGVAGLISPWNLPLYLLTWKLAPAIATGNTAVCKPSEVTPMTADALAGLIVEAGFPDGVINIVLGRGEPCGSALVSHPDVPAISFTGSTRVGQWIGSTAGAMLKRVSLELGGKNPFLIFADADLPAAARTLCRAAFTNQGQICLCASRALVHRSVFEQVRDDVVKLARELVPPGDGRWPQIDGRWPQADGRGHQPPPIAINPQDDACRFGVLSSSAHADKVQGLIDAARSQGATVHLGGERRGCFVPPTILSGLSPSSDIEQTEVFGPVLSMTPFDDDDEAVRLATCTQYGLAAVVFTSSLARAHALPARLHHGIVWVNTWMSRDLRTPFGGHRHSGVGREGGAEALKFFTEPTTVCIAVDGPARR
ncbi:MAG: aldehyde dehydrogenase family protein [Planctomyces sp.]